MTVTLNPRTNAIIATMVGKEEPGSGVLDDVARQVLMRVRAEAMQHRLTGTYMHNLRVVVAPDRHGKDRLVEAFDEAAVPIEFGHWQVTRTRNKRRYSQLRRIPGLHIMGNAYAGLRKLRI